MTIGKSGVILGKVGIGKNDHWEKNALGNSDWGKRPNTIVERTAFRGK